jgi:hypothetical protein
MLSQVAASPPPVLFRAFFREVKDPYAVLDDFAVARYGNGKRKNWFKELFNEF